MLLLAEKKKLGTNKKGPAKKRGSSSSVGRKREEGDEMGFGVMGLRIEGSSSAGSDFCVENEERVQLGPSSLRPPRGFLSQATTGGRSNFHIGSSAAPTAMASVVIGNPNPTVRDRKYNA
jgi:hypothetical protein